ncbi:unnamed protein product [Orchesella dallaii]|uniref:Uncharacterized protein n=1 Tax=Orchesella dallaii TaxID=48710 RepID=A0ABP1PNT1_9HEXA
MLSISTPQSKPMSFYQTLLLPLLFVKEMKKKTEFATQKSGIFNAQFDSRITFMANFFGDSRRLNCYATSEPAFPFSGAFALSFFECVYTTPPHRHATQTRLNAFASLLCLCFYL